MSEQEPMQPTPASFPAGKSTPGTIILVHGIRTRAKWMHEIRPTLEEAGFIVIHTNYGRLDLIRFLLPIPWLRNYSINRVRTDVRRAVQRYPGLPISFIAHSFGTIVVAEILKEGFDFVANRIVFCGSIVNSHFPFEQIANRFESPILNEIGTRDVWPALAESATWGYSSSGTHGFNRPDVQDRHHADAAHSDFLKPEFCKTFWVPFFKDGRIIPTDRTHVSSPWWIRLLSTLRLKYAILVLCALMLVFCQLILSPARVSLNTQKVDMRTREKMNPDFRAAVTSPLEYRDRWLVVGRANVESITGHVAIGNTRLRFEWRWFVDHRPDSGHGWLGIVGQARPFSLSGRIESHEIMFYFDSDDVSWQTLLDQIKIDDNLNALFTFESVISHPMLGLNRTVITRCNVDLDSVRKRLGEFVEVPSRLTPDCLEDHTQRMTRLFYSIP